MLRLREFTHRIMGGLNQLGVNHAVADLQGVLMQRMDRLGAEIAGNVVEQVRAKDDQVLRKLAEIQTETSQLKTLLRELLTTKGFSFSWEALSSVGLRRSHTLDTGVHRSPGR